MDRLKQWLVLSLVALLAILAGGWSLLVSPQRSEAADLRLQAEAQVQSNAQLETQLEVLRAKAEELPAKRAELAEVGVKVPNRPSLPDLVRALTAAARDAGVALTSVTPGTPVPLAVAAPPAPVAPVTDPSAAVPAAPTVPVAPAAPAAGVSEIPVVLEVSGDFYEVEQFLALLEDLPRAMRVSTLVVQAGEATSTGTSTTQDQALRATVTASAFMTAGTAAAAPAPAAPAAPVVAGATDGSPAVDAAATTDVPPTAPAS